MHLVGNGDAFNGVLCLINVIFAYLDEKITSPGCWFLYLYAVIFIYNYLPSERIILVV